MNMKKPSTSQRRKFIQRTALFLSTMGMAGLSKITKSQEKSPVKMLNEKGELVEVDSSILEKMRKVRAEDGDINNWIKTDRI